MHSSPKTLDTNEQGGIPRMQNLDIQYVYYYHSYILFVYMKHIIFRALFLAFRNNVCCLTLRVKFPLFRIPYQNNRIRELFPNFLSRNFKKSEKARNLSELAASRVKVAASRRRFPLDVFPFRRENLESHALKRSKVAPAGRAFVHHVSSLINIMSY